jgi:integrase
MSQLSSIRQRSTPSGAESWQVLYRHDGKQASRTFDSRANAEQWRTLLDALGPTRALDLLATPLPEGTTTVARHVADHIDRLTGVTDGTRRTYRSYLARDMGDIGAIPLSLLSRKAVAEWVNRLDLVQGLSSKSIANRHGLLSGAMNTAVLDGTIPANPCKGTRLPRGHEREMVFLTRDEFADLHSRIRPRYQPLVLLLAGTGMRWSEATALTVRDVDVAARSARIHKAWKMTGTSTRELGVPKTTRSKRTVPVPTPVLDALEPVLAGRKGGEYVFTNAHGAPVKQATFWRLVWAPAVQDFAGDEVRIVKDRAGRPVRQVVRLGDGKHPRVHDLRHTFVSWAIAAGIPLPVIQRVLGHESITTTIDTYGHLARADVDAIADATASNLPRQLRALGQ